MTLALLLLLAGWGWAALANRNTATLWQAVLAAVGCGGGWLVFLGLCGVRWRPWLVLAPCVFGLGLAVAFGKRLAHQLRGNAFYAVTAVTALLLVAGLPAWGWDFRYQWGLKAKVFALFGGFDSGWLANPGVAFAHPKYPPLWPSLMVCLTTLGLTVEPAAGVWTALMRVGLASLCWGLAGEAGLVKRLLASGLGFFAPVLFRPSFSGYAEPLLAFLLAAAVMTVERRRQGSWLWPWLAVSLLGLAKDEGLVWVVSYGVVQWWRLSPRSRLAYLLSLLPITAWLLWTASHLGPSVPTILGWDRVLARFGQLPTAFVHAGPDVLAVSLAFACAVFLAWKRTALAPASILFAGALLVVYLSGPHPLRWWLANSLNRVLAVPLPALLASALNATLTQSDFGKPDKP